LRERKVSGGFFDLLNLFPVKSKFGVVRLKKMNFKPIRRNGMIITYNIAKINTHLGYPIMKERRNSHKVK